MKCFEWPQSTIHCRLLPGLLLFFLSMVFLPFRWQYPAANDFGSEVLPLAAKDYNVRVDTQLTWVQLGLKTVLV